MCLVLDHLSQEEPALIGIAAGYSEFSALNLQMTVKGSSYEELTALPVAEVPLTGTIAYCTPYTAQYASLFNFYVLVSKRQE